jgi:hypothetical protein
MSATVTASPAVEHDHPDPALEQPPEPRVSRLALASLAVACFAFGLWPAMGMPAPLAAGIAILLGYLGRRAIRRAAGGLSGRGFASWGLRLGVLHLVLFGLNTMLFGPLAV